WVSLIAEHLARDRERLVQILASYGVDAGGARDRRAVDAVERLPNRSVDTLKRRPQTFDLRAQPLNLGGTLYGEIRPVGFAARQDHRLPEDVAVTHRRCLPA